MTQYISSTQRWSGQPLFFDNIRCRVRRMDVHYTVLGEMDLSPEYSKYEKEAAA